jgi:hypothetical protein
MDYRITLIQSLRVINIAFHFSFMETKKNKISRYFAHTLYIVFKITLHMAQKDCYSI